MDIGYARVSTLDQDPKLQLNALERAGCGPVYEEKASGVAKHRPVRDAVLDQLKQGDTLTVWKLDRLGRSLVELQEIVNGLRTRGVQFRSLTEHVDTSTGQGKLFFHILAAFAEFERDLIIERTRAGMARRAAEGLHTGGRRRFGMEADQVTVRESEAELLRDAAARLLDGEPLSAIVDGWNAADVPAHAGGSWHASPLRLMLRNPRVVAVVGQETYDALARLFSDSRARQKLGRPAAHLLSGILRCHCGQVMYSKNMGKSRPAYWCRDANSGGRSNGCGKVSISEPRADAWVSEAFFAAVTSDDFAASLDQRRAALLEGEATAVELDDWRAEVAELATILGTRFATDTHRARHAELERLIRQAETRLSARPDLKALISLPRAEAELRATWDGWDVTTRRTWLKRVLDHVTVKPVGSRVGNGKGNSYDVGKRLDPRWKI